MDDASRYHRRRATTKIKGTDSPWLYSSGLRGQGKIAIDLALQPNIVLPRRDVTPTIDGKLDEPVWDDVKSVPFEDTAFSLLGASVDLRLFRDSKSIYLGYRRGQIGHALPNADEATLRNRDSLEVYLSDRGKRLGIRFIIQRNGSAVARLGTLGRSRQVDPKWKGKWECAVQEAPNGWSAELALPLETVTAVGMSPKRLQLNCMSQNLTQSGLEAVFLTDPLYANKFRQCCRFRSIIDAPKGAPKERVLTVRLHFAEMDAMEAGQRVFDVALQSKTVLRNFDVVKEAGGRNAALVKEFAGVKASDRILIELTSERRATDAKSAPVISAVEVVEQE